MLSKSAGPVSRAARHALPIVKLGMRRLLHEKSPFQMTLSLTNRCNFRCTYCEIPLQQSDEMSTAEWLEAIDVARGTPEPGYWEVRGYDVDGWVGRSNGRDDPAV